MSSKFKSFLSVLESKELKMSKLKMKQVVDRYFFHEITDHIENDVYKKIAENLKESNNFISIKRKVNNINKEIDYYSLAANQDSIKAQNDLGVVYYEGKVTKS